MRQVDYIRGYVRLNKEDVWKALKNIKNVIVDVLDENAIKFL